MMFADSGSVRRACVLVGLLLVACARPSRSASEAEDRDREREHHTAPTALGELPATFMGLLPCADCMGIRYRLDLMPGGGFVESATYLREGHDDTFYDLGAWSLVGNGHTLSLAPSRGEATRWSVQGLDGLRKLDRAGKPIESPSPYALGRREGAEPLTARLKLLGTVRYLPGEVRFEDCTTTLEWPIAIAGDYPALERAYATSGLKAGDELLVSLDARIEPLPRGSREREVEGEQEAHEGDAEHEREGGADRLPTLVVEKFRRAMPGEKCPDRAVEASLASTRWRPIRIADRPVTVPEGQHEPWIELDDRSGRVTGSGGCNRISGSYTAADGTLRFGALASTRMACPAMELEQSFLRALEGTRRFRRSGRTLDLLDERGKTLARLEERNLD